MRFLHPCVSLHVCMCVLLCRGQRLMSGIFFHGSIWFPEAWYLTELGVCQFGWGSPVHTCFLSTRLTWKPLGTLCSLHLFVKSSISQPQESSSPFLSSTGIISVGDHTQYSPFPILARARAYTHTHTPSLITKKSLVTVSITSIVIAPGPFKTHVKDILGTFLLKKKKSMQSKLTRIY